jgi:hypothetical protein
MITSIPQILKKMNLTRFSYLYLDDPLQQRLAALADARAWNCPPR